MKTIIKIIIGIIVLYGFYVFSVKVAIDTGMTNAESQEVIIERQEVYQLPDEIINAKCVQFILNGIEKRKLFNDTVKQTSQELGLDYNIVISAILGEQIRISCKGVRGDLKGIIMNTTPTLFRSRNVSVGIAGLKLNTVFRIKSDAKKYFGDTLPVISEEIITENDKISGIYATYLVANIIKRWELEGYDISNNAGVVGTLYNMGNPDKKNPHGDPKLGGAIITIDGQEFTYGEISLGIFNYLENKQKGNE